MACAVAAGALLMLVLCFATPAVAASIFSHALSCEAATVFGEPCWLKDVELATPRDPNALGAGQPRYRFRCNPARLDFPRIQKLILTPTRERWIGSDPGQMEAYRLGSVRGEVPPPPDWKRNIGQIPPWSRARAIAEVDSLPYVNHAVFCWAPRPGAAEAGAAPGSAGVCLFRQGFAVDRPERVVRATLWVASNSQLVEMAFNEAPLFPSPDSQRLLACFEVSHLLRQGANILAIRARERPDALETSYGLAFCLDLIEISPSAPQLPARPVPPALVVTRDGDFVRGWPRDLQGDHVELATPYGPWREDLSDVAGVLFPGGWVDPPAPPGLFRRLLGKTATQAGATPGGAWGLPVLSYPDVPQDCLLLTGNRVAIGKPAYCREGRIHAEDKDGNAFDVALDQALGVRLAPSEDAPVRRPRPEDAVLFCQLTTIDGDRVDGLLRKLAGAGIVLETEGGSIMTFDPRRIAMMTFPYHAPPAATEREGTIALAPLIDERNACRSTYAADARFVQQAAFAIGASVQPLLPMAMADPGALNPKRHPVLVMLDPAGEYLNTLKAPGDAQKTLQAYVEDGGVLVALSRGGAFRAALFGDATGYRHEADASLPNSLLAGLGLTILRPGDAPPAGVVARAFNHPPNHASELYFERASDIPRALLGLPGRVPVDPMPYARYCPMASATALGTTVYRLMDKNGQSYGSALSLIPKGRGMIVVVDQLLWNCRPKAQTIGERVLPIVLSWALSASTS
jgi:hypothetical protein